MADPAAAAALVGGTTPAVPPVIPPAAPPTPGPTAWHAALDAETRGYAELRGLLAKDPVTAFAETARAHREAQAHIGAPADQLLRLPAADAAPEAWAPVWQRLGAPATAAGYDFSTVKFADGSDVEPAAVEFFRKTAADLHLPAAAAPRLASQFVQFLEANDTAEATETVAKIEASKVALKTNWGQNFDANMLLARQAFAAFTPSQDALAAMENTAGYAEVMEFFRKVGSHMGEARFVAGGMPAQGLLTRDGAVARIDELKADSEWVKKFLAGGAAEKREMDNLHTIAYSPAP
jgi:hypothetical protein